MNNFSGIGRAGRDAVTRHTQNGKAVTGFPLAIDTGFGESRQTTWLDCSAWGDRFSKVCEYIKKGDRVGVVGEIGSREHDGKTYVTLNVRDITLLGAKREERAKESGAKARAPSERDDFEDDEIPF